MSGSDPSATPFRPASPARPEPAPGEAWVVVGSGGHGREVADVIALKGGRVLGFLDDDPAKAGTTVGDLPVLGGLDWVTHWPGALHVGLGIGASAARRRVVERLDAMAAPIDFPVIIHPNALVGSRVGLGRGCQVQAGCILTCDIEVGEFVVLNVGVSLSHDVRVGDYATLAPGARLAGAVHVGALAEIGMATHAIQGRDLGEACTTGAGAVVVRNVTSHATVVGVPARPIHTS